MKLRIIGWAAMGNLLVVTPALAWGVGSPNPAPEAPLEAPAPASPAPSPPSVEPSPAPAAPGPPAPPAAETATPMPEAAPPRPPDAAPISVELEETPAPAPAPAQPLPPALRPAPNSAEAAPADEPPVEPRRERERHWYGWQLLIADGASFALIAAGNNSAVGGWGFASYLFTPPIIHWGHGQTGKGFGSLALRVGLPLGGALFGAFVSGCARGHGGCSSDAPAVGALLGVAGVVAIDAALLGYEDKKPHRSSARELRPTFDVGRHDARVGLAGTF